MKTSRICMTAAALTLGLVACGSGSSGDDANAQGNLSPSAITAERHLVADFTNASLLLRDAAYANLKSFPKEAGAGKTATDESSPGASENSPAADWADKTQKITAIFLQKWTTADKIEPALYIAETSSVQSNSSVPAGDEQPANSGLLLNGLVPALRNVVPTVTGRIFVTFVTPLVYNDGNKCTLFGIKDNVIECADTEFVEISPIGADDDGSLYYLAYDGLDKYIRKRNAMDGVISNIASTADLSYYNVADLLKLNPMGGVFLISRTLTDGHNVYSVKKFGTEGISEVTLPEDYTIIESSKISLAGNGKIVFIGTYDNDPDTEGIYSVSFDNPSPVLLFNLAENELDDHEVYFPVITDPQGNSWLGKFGNEIFKLDTEAEFTPVFEEMGWIMPTLKSNVYYSILSGENADENRQISRVTFSNGSIVTEKIAEISAKISMTNLYRYSPPPESIYFGPVYQGSDGRIFVTNYSSAVATEIVYWNSNGEMQTDLAGTSGVVLYPLSGI